MSQRQHTRVLVVDDNDSLRKRLVPLFDTYDDLEMVGEAANGQEAVDMCERLQPDVILMDLNMPVMDGVAATRIISQKYPHIYVIIFTLSSGIKRIMDAIRAGAKGYIRKNVPIAEIVLAIRAMVTKGS
jgi:DNA-binding NarL/FixJ family response regulator